MIKNSEGDQNLTKLVDQLLNAKNDVDNYHDNKKTVADTLPSLTSSLSDLVQMIDTYKTLNPSNDNKD